MLTGKRKLCILTLDHYSKEGPGLGLAREGAPGLELCRVDVMGTLVKFRGGPATVSLTKLPCH